MSKVLLLTYLIISLSSTGSAQEFFSGQPVSHDNFFSPIKGSPLLFNDWVKGKVVSNNALFKNDSMLFNLDKVSQRLLATVDKQIEYKIDKKEFQSVTFYLGDLTCTFEHVPAINYKDLFFVIIKTDDKYSLYKYMHTEIRGRTYVEWAVYYILFPFPEVHFLRLNTVNKKVIQRAFALSKDFQKINNYYSQHSTDEPNEYFLKKMVEYLNE
ncbi:MAG TPA: hypothetical protein VNV85_03630 [Puia sp.]|nr:hypothetical protein [Puia sp.]